MKPFWIIAVAALLGGCTMQEPSNENPAPAPVVETTNARASSALAFDPALIQDQPSIDLARTGLGEAAFAGFEDTSTSYYDVFTDNRVANDGSDRFYREGYVERIGSISR